mmetsp:Transcript_3197/g.4863  ORF Transcript_3197/g.4863 Transcript_3197/m.4863 type:complete len:82 (-) Transcript_3197:127-372(-)
MPHRIGGQSKGLDIVGSSRGGGGAAKAIWGRVTAELAINPKAPYVDSVKNDLRVDSEPWGKARQATSCQEKKLSKIITTAT